jgi:quercetin dioxygenase-like cupin family protein
MAKRILNILAAMPGKGRTYREPVYDCRNHEIHLWRVIPGEWIYPHTHPHTDDIWYIVQGQGVYYTTAQETQTVGAGDLTLASPDDVHGIFNSGAEDMIILSVLAPLPVEYAEAPGFEYPEK